MNMFDKYTSNYDMNDPDINYKYYHSYRVMEIMEKLAITLNLSPKDIELAKVIGLLHDIGRFEQDKLYDSFKDGKFDHGDYGEKLLKETNFLKHFDILEEDYEVVYKAVKNHNKYGIENTQNERELFFSKLIKDADKLDILYVLGSDKFDMLEKDNKDDISKEIKDAFINNKLGNIKEIKTQNDKLIIPFTYIYDINFKESLKIIDKNKYYDKIYEKINNKDIFKEYIEYTNKYIAERID
ncbi:MAG: HD domain-containing protein [Bacilli bacterium]|nr:HD domain-containing protein [Bacilli bacterium]